MKALLLTANIQTPWPLVHRQREITGCLIKKSYAQLRHPILYLIVLKNVSIQQDPEESEKKRRLF